MLLEVLFNSIHEKLFVKGEFGSSKYVLFSFKVIMYQKCNKYVIA